MSLVYVTLVVIKNAMSMNLSKYDTNGNKYFILLIANYYLYICFSLKLVIKTFMYLISHKTYNDF